MKLLLPASIFILMVSVGMSLRLTDLVANWRRYTWVSWTRLVLATFIVPALVALILARAFFLTLPETGALFMVGAMPGAPLLTRNLARRGFDMQLAASYQVWCGALTPILIPVMIWAAAKLYSRSIWIPPRVLLLQIVEKQFLPLLVGMMLMRLAPSFSKKVQRGMNVVGNLLLTLVFVLLLWKMRADLATVTPWMVLADFLLLLAAIAGMHLLLRVDPITVRTLSVSNANRHVGLALLLMGRFHRMRDGLPVIASYAILVAIFLVVAPKIFRPQELVARKATA
jgi:bile acid:Na+ symporter, BASS family